MTGVHHTAICTADLDAALRFWRDGLGLSELMDLSFDGDWPTLFGAAGRELHSVFLGDPAQPDSGVVELVVFPDARPGSAVPPSPTVGVFLLSFQREVEPTLARLGELGFTSGVRRIAMPAGRGTSVAMAVVHAPDGVLVELVGPAQ